MLGFFAFLIWCLVLLLSVALLVGLGLFLIWAIAHTDMFFGFVREGTGYARMRGENLVFIGMVWKGYHLRESTAKFTKGTLEVCGNQAELAKIERALKRQKEPALTPEEITEILEKELACMESLVATNPFLAFLEKYLRVYWMGFWPFEKRYSYEMSWNEWSRDPDKPSHTLWKREEPTNFFYVQTFEYAALLKGAETTDSVPVDVKFSLMVRIFFPEIALFRNENWFNLLLSMALKRARIYVGQRSFEELHAETAPGSSAPRGSGSNGNDAETSFTHWMREINMRIEGDEYRRGMLNRLGVGISNAQIVTVDLASEEGGLAAATTELYRSRQKAKGIREIADANRYAIEQDIEASTSHDAGPFVRGRRALETAGAQGNTIVFDREGDSPFLKDLLAAQKEADKKNQGGGGGKS